MGIGQGAFRPKEPVDLPTNTEVEVLLPVPVRMRDEEDDPTGGKTAGELIGCITEEPLATDVSVNADRYIHRRHT
jgi:hypothetical protein